MPIYEYECEQDGTVLELIRPMVEADAPVADPEGRGRRFVRRLSMFSPKSGADRALPLGQGCACGNPQGPCSAR